MKRSKSSPAAIIGLAALTLLLVSLAATNWALLSWSPDIHPDGTVPAVKGSGTGGPPARPTPAAQPRPSVYASIQARPLFDATRRPPQVAETKQQAPAPAPAATPFPAEKFKLVGILRTRDLPAKALIRASASGAGTWVTIGATIAGWKLEEITDDHVNLTANGTTGVLKLTTTPAASAVPPAAAPSHNAPPAKTPLPKKPLYK